MNKIGQAELIKLLEKHGKPMPCKLIIENLIGEMNRITIMHAIRTLIKSKEIGFIQIDYIKAKKYSPNSKRCLKLYFVKK